jgi:hypothetical protein
MELDDRMPVLNPRLVDHGLWRPEWIIRDFHDPTGEIGRWGREGASLAEILRGFPGSLVRMQRFLGNCLLNEGINAAWTLICGGSATAFNTANTYMGAGDSNTAAAALQTGLQASTNKYYNPIDATYPTYGSSQQAVFRSTFAAGVANFDWEELTAANGGTDASVNLNRLVQAMGTKTSAWARQPTLTITIA